MTFDLSSLSSEKGYKISGFENDHLDFNICGKLKTPCAGDANAAACLKKNGKEYKFGMKVQ